MKKKNYTQKATQRAIEQLFWEANNVIYSKHLTDSEKRQIGDFLDTLSKVRYRLSGLKETKT